MVDNEQMGAEVGDQGEQVRADEERGPTGGGQLADALLHGADAARVRRVRGSSKRIALGL